ncbi:hypothetical protein LTR70_003020 [Exophiala xenobiotica]|uniref:Fe2OG dioxygenase domain-containing protein n=1 Tax=Lithohypha guttulata TaxID=1690604 RepID=A0ABR0K8A5_9EURO|nr:hypothetical protein LTR24_005700 [Lithohypha guttulata]KAK5324390.1 hypothetical protein LTR70_003020 [Exophiala xenobiotica]
MSLTKKRKTLDDFFINNRPSKQTRTPTATKPLQVHEDIPGLRVLTDFVTVEEEQALLRFFELQEWRTDLARRVIHYGGTYCLMPPRTATLEQRIQIDKTILTAPPIPNQLDFLISRMIGQNLYTNATAPEYCIVNEYKGRQGISAHVENFRFKSPVCGLTLDQGDWMRFHELRYPNDGSVRSGKASQAERTNKVKDVWMPPRSLLVMEGEAREKWQHEIVRSKRGRSAPCWRRISLTFRTDKCK